MTPRLSREAAANYYSLGVALSRRNRGTLAAVARVLIPSGGPVPPGADDLDLPRKIADDVDNYPRFGHRQIRLLLFAIEHYPLISGHVRRFSRLPPEKQATFLDTTAHHKRSALRRLVVSYLKQLCYGMYVSEPDVEAAVGYRYECARPMAMRAAPEDQIHH